ncbi:hypothetical protein EPN28_02800 [Patescibacteria group bacterium]|nr:MAG: hypothetical protein EPN28_02800 [Patescibacteria group bacterium]
MPTKRRITSIQPVEAPPEIAAKKTVPKWVVFVLVVILLLVSGAFVWAYANNVSVSKKLIVDSVDAQRQEVKNQIKELVAQVNRHIVLPEGEEPTVATINDAETLAKTQPFYTGAHNGDKILIYVRAQKAFIYDPNRDVLVNVGPVSLQPKPAAPAQESASKKTGATTE